MVEKLDIARIAPQHGAPSKGTAIGPLLAWLGGLACGIDLMGQDQYRIPPAELRIRI